MSQSHQHNSFTTGLAMFSMFFGAGNVVFPLAVGQSTQAQTPYAMLGLLITGVIMPFAGLMAMTLFKGNYHRFFGRLGIWPGFLLSILLFALLGPFGAMPRTVTLSYSTMKIYLPWLSLPWFSAASCALIFLFTYRKTRILDLLGYVLTPILILSLMVIIVKGLWMAESFSPTELSSGHAFLFGLTEGYNTMDLLGALFFSSVVLNCLKVDQAPGTETDYSQLTWVTLKASFVGASLLAMVYTGFSLVAAFHQEALAGLPLEELIGRLGIHVLGPFAGVVASVAVALACLTTAIALASVFADFLRDDIFKGRLNYLWCLVITLVAMFGMSNLEFSGIVSLLSPILITLYPALIGLSLCNMAYQLKGFKPVRLPALILLVLASAYYILG